MDLSAGLQSVYRYSLPHRTPEDGNSIAKRAEGKKVVIVGASFIGMEVAAFLSTKSGATSVTVAGNTRLPFENTLGKEVSLFIFIFLFSRGSKLQLLLKSSSQVGEWIMKLHQTKGNVQFVMGSTPAAFMGDEQGGDAGSLTKVVLADGTELEADLCVLGVGVDPNTDYLKSSAVKTDARGFVEGMLTTMETAVDHHHLTSLPSYKHFLQSTRT